MTSVLPCSQGSLLSSDSILGMMSTVGARCSLWLCCQQQQRDRAAARTRAGGPECLAQHPAELLAWLSPSPPYPFPLPPSPHLLPPDVSQNPPLWALPGRPHPQHLHWGALQAPQCQAGSRFPLSQVFSCLILVCDYCSCF